MELRQKPGQLSLGAAVAVLLVAAGCASSHGVTVLKQPTTFPIVISQPGSYRVESNIVVPDANTTAIKIESRDVTIDLNGFAILGPTVCSGIPVSCTPTGSGSGITATGNAGTRENVTVRNGSIKGMGADGVDLSEQSTVSEVRAISNGNNGIMGNTGSRITGSVAIQNGNWGIATASTSIVTGNVASQNRNYGINAASWGVVSGNTASLNTTDGIACADSCTVTGNTAHRNGFGSGVTGRGMVIGAGSTVIGNTVSGNRGVGLSIQTGGGYVNNVLNDNNGGNANPQVSGGIKLGPNICGGVICP